MSIVKEKHTYYIFALSCDGDCGNNTETFSTLIESIREAQRLGWRTGVKNGLAVGDYCQDCYAKIESTDVR